MPATKGRIEVPVVSVEQFGRTMYVGAIEATDLARMYDTGTAVVDIWDPDARPEGYQRSLSPTRARRFGRFLGEKNLAPTSVLMYVRNPIDGVEVRGEKLVIPLVENPARDPSRASLFLVDGQHRTFGISEAVKEGWLSHGTRIDIPVTFVFADGKGSTDPILEEAYQFLTLNNEQKRVRTDLAHQLILRKESVGKGSIRDGTLIPSGETGKELLPYVTTAVNKLSERPTSPWHDRIVRPNSPRNTTGWPSQGQFEDALLDNYLGLGSVVSWAAGSGLTVGDLVQLLSNYWGAIFDLIPEAVADPDSYVLTKTAGIHSLNGLLPALFSKRRNLPRIPSVEEFKAVLTTMDAVFSEEYWSSAKGEASSYGTGKKSFKNLTKAISETLSPQ